MSELKGFLYTEKSLCGTFDYILEKLIREEGKGVYKRVTFRTPDFDGEVNYYVDKSIEAHIIGIGNINFFTAQTEL